MYNQNFIINDLTDKILERFYETFEGTLDTLDFVPPASQRLISAFLDKQLRKTLKQVPKEYKRLMKERKKMIKKKVISKEDLFSQSILREFYKKFNIESKDKKRDVARDATSVVENNASVEDNSEGISAENIDASTGVAENSTRNEENTSDIGVEEVVEQQELVPERESAPPGDNA